MPAFRNFHLRPEQAGQTLAAVLRAALSGKSWADVKKWLHERHVQVNGNLTTDESRRMKVGDVVKVWDYPQAAPPGEADVKIIYLDAHLVVVEKPAGMTTLRHAEEAEWSDERKSRQPTLDDLLPNVIARHPLWKSVMHGDRSQAAAGGGQGAAGSAQGVGDDSRQKKHPLHAHPTHEHPLHRDQGKSAKGASAKSSFQPKPKLQKVQAPRPRADARPTVFKKPDVRPVHRLDRDTSGLMVFALTSVAETELVALFKAHNITRSYLAVALGMVDAQTIATYLVRDRSDGRRGSSTRGKEAPGAQHAVTHVKPIENLGGRHTLIECTLETGRTHQIRIHLSEIGHMLAGERTYHVAPNGAATKDTSGAPRQALHAHELGFVHPVSGKVMHFKSPLPTELKSWLDRLRERTADTPRSNPEKPVA